MSVKFPLPLPFLRTKEAARFIGVSPHTLEKHRIYGTGPQYSKIGGRIIYAVKELREWVERGARRATSDPGKTTIPPAKPDDKVNQIELSETAQLASNAMLPGSILATSDPGKTTVLGAIPANRRAIKLEGGVR